MVKKILLAAILAGIWLVFSALGQGGLSTAKAQEGTTPSPSACASCHRAQYLLYDSGKYYCMCRRQADCSFCHGGDPMAYDEMLAHTGLIVSPIRDNPQACRNCHGESTDHYIARFVSLAGVRSQQAPPPLAGMVGTASPSTLLQGGRRFASWQIAGLGLTLLGALLVFAWGCRCYRQEHS